MNTELAREAKTSVKSLSLAPSILLKLHEMFPERYPHLLESAATDTTGAFDILFAFPGDTLTLDRSGLRYSGQGALEQPDFLGSFDALWSKNAHLGSWHGALPFLGGWFLYLGYELAQQIEPSLVLPEAEDTGIVARATRFPAACMFDHQTNQLVLVAEPGAAHLLPQIENDIATAAQGSNAGDVPIALELREEDPAIFLENVEKILNYIHDGDVFQVNLSRKWSGIPCARIPASALYHRIRQSNPGPFNGLATWKDLAIVCSSPERLVKVSDGVIETRPIAGTRPRGSDTTEDTALSNELLRHPKERAEHIMLIDLERNDLGRVCEPGSVEVNEFMSVESYAAVHHIVSNVRGQLRSDVTPGDVIRAVFPGGTITGCPKVRCMQIIAELEQTGRGAYTGSIGYVNHNGSMDLNILIRTLTLGEAGVTLRAGAGIVADSSAEREIEETRAKAHALLRVLETNYDVHG